MLKPDPQYVRTLLARYASARIALANNSDAEPMWERELEDVTYTLCVTTGTRSIGDALAAADEILAAPAQGEVASRTSDATDTTLAA
ncbi:DUF5133 domain-containing protein [Streptomyces sp. NPDC050856]|uniref:DUF5133 domain-containing protein n=1 Tax=Streptomyces sp. NPDC050856 TaxID=3154939 RepID=UPI00340730DC